MAMGFNKNWIRPADLNRVTDSPRFQGVSGGMLPLKILKLQSPNKRFPAFRESLGD